jgi:hypothetical protein
MAWNPVASTWGNGPVPITYSIDEETGVIFEVWEGDVTAACLRRYWELYLADPQVMAIRRTLVDLREARIRFTGAELSSLISTVVVPALEGRDWTTALVVARPVEFGVSRQYQVYAERYSRDAIFEDYTVALAWLTRQA